MRVVRLAGAAVVMAACGGGDGGGGGGTPPPPPVASVTISPATAQSIAACATVSFAAQARDAQNNVLTGRPISWATSDGAKVALSTTSGTSTTATGVGVGSATITASSGSVQSNPGVTVAVTPGAASASAGVTATTNDTFSPNCVAITAGGTVTWTFESRTHNVIFGTNKPTGGDIPPSTSTTVSRTFPTAGNFEYDCTLHAGMRGRVVVVQ